MTQPQDDIPKNPRLSKADPLDTLEQDSDASFPPETLKESASGSAFDDMADTQRLVRFTPGAKFERYHLIRKIGQGGMGEVYLAQHARLTSRYYAIKFLKSDYVSDRWRQRFEAEIDAMERLRHPNIVFAEDAGEYNGNAYLAMEFVDGKDLSAVTKEFGALPINDATEIIRQTALGLQHANERSLVHRDLKPSNLMLSTDGVVKILDLGLARIRDRAVEEGLTGSMQLLGTPDYMAPEQCQSSRDVDIRADIYSLGCTLYCLLCGQPPFGDKEHGSVATKLTAQIAETPKPLSMMAPQEVPAKLDRIAAKMMAKEPAERFQTPSEVVAAMNPFAAGSDLSRLTVGITTAATITARVTQELGAANQDTAKTAQLETAPVAGEKKSSLPSLSCMVTIALCLMMAVLIPYAWQKVSSSVVESINSVSGMGTPDFNNETGETGDSGDSDGGSSGSTAPEMESKVGAEIESANANDKAEEKDVEEKDVEKADPNSTTGSAATKIVAEYLERLKKDKEIKFPGQEFLRMGEIGEDVFEADFGECVRVDVEFDRPTYCYLIALNPSEDKKMRIQLCYPANETVVPVQVDELSFPESTTTYFLLNDGVGQFAWVLVQSEEPLPPFDEWRSKTIDGEFPWKKHEQGGVWAWDGKELLARNRRVNRGRSVDTTPVVLKKVIDDLLEKELEFRVLAFPVGGDDKNLKKGGLHTNDSPKNSTQLDPDSKQSLGEMLRDELPETNKLSIREREELGTMLSDLSVGVSLRGGFVEQVKGAFASGPLEPKKWAQLGSRAQELNTQSVDAMKLTNRLMVEVEDNERETMQAVVKSLGEMSSLLDELTRLEFPLTSAQQTRVKLIGTEVLGVSETLSKNSKAIRVSLSSK